MTAPRPCSLASAATTIVKHLTEMFGEKLSLFSRRFLAFRVAKEHDEDMRSYAARVNKLYEQGRVKEMKEDEEKCLLFVAGLSDQAHRDIRKKLIRILESKNDVKLDDLLRECDLQTSLNMDVVVEQHASVNRIQQSGYRKNWNKGPKPTSSNGGSKPCDANDRPRGDKRNDVCHHCGKRGHWAKECRSDSGNRGGSFSKQGKQNRNKDWKPKVNQVVQINAIDSTRKDVEISIEGNHFTLQLDTGAAVTIIDEAVWHQLNCPPLTPSDIQLRAANGTWSLLCHQRHSVDGAGLDQSAATIRILFR
ncbi:unnamed protein product, partial [Mesorhabditis spiculigera]